MTKSHHIVDKLLETDTSELDRQPAQSRSPGEDTSGKKLKSPKLKKSDPKEGFAEKPFPEAVVRRLLDD